MRSGLFIVDKHTKKKHQKIFNNDHIATTTPDSCPEPSRVEAKEALLERLARYPITEMHEKILVGRFFHGETFSEIAKNIGVNIRYVHAYYQEAMDIIRKEELKDE